jgi:hypothetical protein
MVFLRIKEASSLPSIVTPVDISSTTSLFLVRSGRVSMKVNAPVQTGERSASTGSGVLQSAGVKLSIKEVMKCIGGVSLSYFWEHCWMLSQRKTTIAMMARSKMRRADQIFFIGYRGERIKLFIRNFIHRLIFY